MNLRQEIVKLARAYPETRKHLVPLLKDAAAPPDYKSYVKKKQQQGKRPLSKDDWERKVLNTGQSGDALKKQKDDKKQKEDARGYSKRVNNFIDQLGLDDQDLAMMKKFPKADRDPMHARQTLDKFLKGAPPKLKKKFKGVATNNFMTILNAVAGVKGKAKPKEEAEKPSEDKPKKEKSKAELKKDYIEAIQKSKMSPEDKKKALEQAKQPGFDPGAALGAMGDDDEETGGKQASLRQDMLRLAHAVPETRKYLIPMLKQAGSLDKTAAITFTDKELETVAKMTDQNDHNGARMWLANKMKVKKYVKAFEGIQMIHHALGSMPHELIVLRDRLTKDLWSSLQRQVSPDDFDKIHAAF